jgi:hypothetical protein
MAAADWAIEGGQSGEVGIRVLCDELPRGFTAA